MPYLNKKQLYNFEKKVFISALIHYSGGLEHTAMDESAQYLWEYYKEEISEKEFDEKMQAIFTKQKGGKQ